MKAVELRITLTPDTGAVHIEGPLEQRMLCYGLLDMGREIIMKRGLTVAGPQNGKKIIVPEMQIRLEKP